jgi:hypothetical protein
MHKRCPFPPGQCRVTKHRIQRLSQIKIRSLSKAHADPQHPLADPHFRAHCRRQAGMGCGGRVRHQRLGIADVVRNIDHLERVEHLVRGLTPAIDLERKH